MFLKPNAQVDPRQKALDSALMLLVHKKMSETGRENRRDLKTKYPPARNGATNFEPSFSPNPVSRKGGPANKNIMAALSQYMNPSKPLPFDMSQLQGTPGGDPNSTTSFNPNAVLDTSQVQDMRGTTYSGNMPMMPGLIPRQTGPYMGGPLSRTQGKGFGAGALEQDGGFKTQGLQAILEMLRRRGAFAGDGNNVRPGPMFRNGE